ncbi:MAG TPA: hypothetical protein VG406_14135 [Isosphaeraceae bacterium]|nr:hypothetical protein [Isosphaeraceae bacterium]
MEQRQPTRLEATPPLPTSRRDFLQQADEPPGLDRIVRGLASPYVHLNSPPAFNDP